MKILIVEDELLERMAMIRLIQERYRKKVTVLTAEDGVKAVKLALEERPDFVLMDINLPLLDGISAAKQIRMTIPDISIMIVSAYSDYEHMRGAILNQAVDYLVKPYSAETLYEAVDRGLCGNQKDENFYGKAGTIRKVKKFLETHYAENISLKDVADEVCLEKSYLGRMFREECGITVMSYLRNIRIQQAQKLLIQGMPPGEVAEKTGFGDPAYFAKSFKQSVGISPARYKET